MAARVLVGMTTSIDGFVSDRNGSVGALFDDLDDIAGNAYWQDLIANTGAVVMGARTFAMGDPDSYVGNYEFQVPIFVLTNQPPAVAPKQDEHLSFTFVTDGVESAIAQAKAAAGDDTIIQVVGGPDVTNQVLRAGLADELSIDVMPVLFGSGKRLFSDDGLASVTVEKIGVQELGVRTILRFRVVR